MESEYEYDDLGSGFDGSSSSSMNPHLGTVSNVNGRNPYDTSGSLQLAPIYSNPIHQRESIGDILNRYQGRPSSSDHGDFYENNYEENVESHFGFDNRGAHVGVCMSRTHQTPFGNARTDVGMQMSVGYGGLAIRTSSRTSLSGDGHGQFHTIGFPGGSRYRSPFGDPMFQPMGSMLSPFGGLFSPFGGMFALPSGSHSPCHDSSPFGFVRQNSPSQNQDMSTGSEGPIIEEIFDEEENDRSCLTYETTAGSHLAIEETTEDRYSSLGLGLLPDTETNYSISSEENQVMGDGNSEHTSGGILNDSAYSEALTSAKNITGLKADIDSDKGESDKSRNPNAPRFREGQAVTANSFGSSQENDQQRPSIIHNAPQEIQTSVEYTNSGDNSRIVLAGTKDKPKFTKRTFKNTHFQLKDDDASLPFLRPSFEESKRININQPDDQLTVELDVNETLKLKENSEQRKAKRESTNKNTFLRRRNDSVCSSSSEQDRNTDIESFESLKTSTPQQSKSTKEVRIDTLSTAFDTVTIDEHISDEPHTCKTTTLKEHDGSLFSSSSAKNQSISFEPNQCSDEAYVKSVSPDEMCENLDVYSKDSMAIHSGCIEEKIHKDTCSLNEARYTEDDIKRHADNISQCTYKITDGTKEDVFEKSLIDTSDVLTETEKRKNENWKDDSNEQEERDGGKVSLQQTSVPFSPDMEISNSNNLYENKDNEENSRPDNNHEDTASNINNDRNQTKQGLTKTSDPSRSLMASEVANAPTPSANHSESKVSPFPAEMDNALGTDRLHFLLIISTDDSQRRLDGPITTFMSKESRKIEAGNRFNIISYEAEGQMQNKSMQPNISEKTENDSSYRHNTFQIRTEPDRPNDIFKDSAHDEIDPNADTMEIEDYFSEKKTRPGQNQDKTTTKNDEGELSSCHAIQQFQSEPNLKKQTETDGLPSTLNTGGHSFENTENVPPSDKKHKASPQIIQSRENTSQRIMPSDEKYCRGIEWQYPDQVSQSNKQSHRNNRSAHKVSYSHATDKAGNSVGHRDHTCMCQSKCKHLHIQKKTDTCICGHTHVCYDCNKRFTAKDYDRFKQDAGEDEIFDHPEWEHLKEYGNKHSQFTDPKPKPTKTIVNKNTVARSTRTVSTASQEKQTGSSKGVQETRPSNYSNPTNDLNDLVESVGLVMKDVFPDGNCLFTSICDQLRIRGDFSYTPRNLRHAAVYFLREHPHQEDGTPLLAFLTDDERDWDKYLNSMSRDGHWGDHFVIWALAHVLNKRIVIYRGHAELQKTIVEPTGPIKSAGRFGRMTSPNDEASGNNSEEGKEEVPYVDHPLQPSHNVEELYLGHISQSHYVSLRPNDWHQRLMEVLKNKQTSCLVGSNPKSRQMDSNGDVSVGKEVPIFSSDDLNYFLNYIRRGGLLINYEMKRAHYKNGSVTHFKKMKRKCEDESEFMTNYLIGDIGYQFLSKKQTQREMDQCNPYYYLSTPKDTAVVKDVREGSKKDLIIQNESCKVGQCKLTPVTPHLWKPNLKIIGSLAFLSHIEYKSTSPFVKNCMFVALKCASWPEHAMEWKNRSRPNDWPSQSTIEEIIEKGVRIIPAKNKTSIDKGLHSKTSLVKITENGDNPDIDGRSLGEHNSLAEVREFGPEKEQWNLIWEYNFDISESILCEREFSREAKMLHCILEAVSSFVFEGRDMLTRRHLKALAFFTCERFSAEDIRQRPGKCLLFEISLLTDYLQRKHFPHYFMRGRNLVADMEYRDIVWHIERLQVLKIHLMPILYFVLDFCTLRNVYDVGNIFDDLVEAVDKRRMESKTQAMYMLPLCVAAITNCAKSKQFEKLETQIDIWFNELTNTYGRIMISKQQFVHEILFHMPLQEQWLFAFYLECTKGSEFIQFVCKGKSSVQFENLFGDEAVSVLCEDTSLRYEEIPVPTAFLGDSMIGFALRLSDVLEIDICSSKAFEAAIHYFLKANTHDLLLSIEKDQKDYEDYYSHGKISDLRRLFQYLYYSYEKKDARLFYDMMDLYDELCNFVATASEFEVLAGLWTYFGDYEKAREAQMKAVSVREEAFSTI